MNFIKENYFYAEVKINMDFLEFLRNLLRLK